MKYVIDTGHEGIGSSRGIIREYNPAVGTWIPVLTSRIQKTRYGTNIIGIPARTQDGTWIRIDTYIGSEGETTERRFALGKQDYSPMFIGAYGDDAGNGRYHPKCHCCWLGFSHTLAEHDAHAVGSWD